MIYGVTYTISNVQKISLYVVLYKTRLENEPLGCSQNISYYHKGVGDDFKGEWLRVSEYIQCVQSVTNLQNRNLWKKEMKNVVSENHRLYSLFVSGNEKCKNSNVPDAPGKV